jgi:DNA replication protein DnaC
MLQSVAITVGVGKTHVAQALGHLAVRNAAKTRFFKTCRVLAHLAGGHADRTWDKRLRELTRPAVRILDDFSMRELTPAQADDLYELITERARRSLILTSNRAPADWYPLFPNPVVAESLLGPAHQHQPPGLHERAELPPEQATRPHNPAEKEDIR